MPTQAEEDLPAGCGLANFTPRDCGLESVLDEASCAVSSYRHAECRRRQPSSSLPAPRTPASKSAVPGKRATSGSRGRVTCRATARPMGDQRAIEALIWCPQNAQKLSLSRGTCRGVGHRACTSRSCTEIDPDARSHTLAVGSRCLFDKPNVRTETTTSGS